MKIHLILLLGFLIVSSGSILFAQTPEQIDVKLMQISKVGSAGVTSFRMEALNSTQNTVVYQSVDSGILGIIPFSIACPCSPPELYSTNVPSELIANLGTTVGRVLFYTNFSTSSPIALNQRVLSKKKDFLISGAMELRGRIEVRNRTDLIIAVDNDVVLKGNYSVLYWKPYISANGTRVTDFKSVIYSLNAPAN